MDNLIRLDELFENGTVKEKREIVGSIFPKISLSTDRFIEPPA
jgi:hypothetical protein